MLAFLLGVGAAGCWGVADFLGGLTTRKTSVFLVVLISQAIGAAALLVGLAAMGELELQRGQILMIVLAGVSAVFGLTLFYRAMAIGTMSVVAPIAATSVSIPVLVGLLSGERPSTANAVGMATAVLGVILASQEEDLSHAERSDARSGVILALLSAVFIGTSLTALARASDFGVVTATVWTRVASLIVLSLIVGVIRPALAPARSQLSAIAWVGLLDTGGMCLYAAATTQGLLSVVAVLVAVFPVVTVLLARLVLKERIRRIQEIGIVLTLTGVGLLASGL